MIDEIQATGSNYPPERISRIRPADRSRPPADVPASDGDRVEISELAYWRAKVASLPEVRIEKVTAVRSALAEGTYETAERLDIAVDRLMADLGEAI